MLTHGYYLCHGKCNHNHNRLIAEYRHSPIRAKSFSILCPHRSLSLFESYSLVSTSVHSSPLFKSHFRLSRTSFVPATSCALLSKWNYAPTGRRLGSQADVKDCEYDALRTCLDLKPKPHEKRGNGVTKISANRAPETLVP